MDSAAGRAGRRRHRKGPGGRSRHRARRRHRQVRRPSGVGDARTAAPGRRRAGRQGSRGRASSARAQKQDIKVKLGRLEEAEATEVAALAADEPAPQPDEPAVVTGPLGLSLSDLSPTLRSKFGIKDEIKGVVVTDVAEGSPAAEKRIQAGDVILEISQEPVRFAGGDRGADQAAQDGWPEVGASAARQQERRPALRRRDDRLSWLHSARGHAPAPFVRLGDHPTNLLADSPAM